MPNIGKWPGRLHYISVADVGAVQRDISNDVKTVNAPASAQAHDVSGGGDIRKVYVVGQQDQTITIEGPWDSTANKVHQVLGGVAGTTGLVGGTAGSLFVYGPAGSVTGYPKLAGSVYCTQYDVHSDVTAAVTWRATLVPSDETGLVWGSF